MADEHMLRRLRVLAREALCILAATFILSASAVMADDDMTSFRVGMIADVQYADRDDRRQRLYRRAPEKLAAAVADLNQQDLAFVVHLGDFIDRDWESFDVVEPIAAELVHPLRHALGNHDLEVEDARKLDVPQRLGMPARYYSFEVGDWTFAVVDGNDHSLFGWPEGSERHAESVALREAEYPNEPHWNGAMGEEQLDWLTVLLADADAAGRNVAVLSHYPVLPRGRHHLWNAKDVIARIEPHPSLKVWINGHNHDGAYMERNGVHYLTLKGMLDTEETAYAVVTFSKDAIRVNGAGRQGDFVLGVR